MNTLKYWKKCTGNISLSENFKLQFFTHKTHTERLGDANVKSTEVKLNHSLASNLKSEMIQLSKQKCKNYASSKLATNISEKIEVYVIRWHHYAKWAKFHPHKRVGYSIIFSARLINARLKFHNRELFKWLIQSSRTINYDVFFFFFSILNHSTAFILSFYLTRCVYPT